jgi:hypothetical protein
MPAPHAAAPRREILTKLLASKKQTIENVKKVNVLLDVLNDKFRQEQELSGKKVCDIVAVIEKARIKQPRRQAASSGSSGSSGSGRGSGRGRGSRGRAADPCESPTTLRKLLLCMKKCCVTASKTSKENKGSRAGKAGKKVRTAAQ